VTDWRDQAACRTEDPELFFSPGQRDRARGICARCPVRQPCLEFARSHGIVHGIWGGLTRGERSGARKPRGAVADTAAYLPMLDQLVEVLKCIAAVTVPADPEAAEHRRVLLRELDAYEAAHPGPHRWGQVPASGEPRLERPAPDDRLAVLRAARNEARRYRMADLPVPASVSELEREFWRTAKQQGRERNAA